MDLLGADDMKWDMRIIAKYAQKRLEKALQDKYAVHLEKGKNFIDYIHDDLSNTTNKAVRKIYNELLKAGKEIPTQHHASMIVDLGAFLLWVVYNDTAYRDPTFSILHNLISDPALKDDLKEYVKEPKDWYCPRWIQSKKSTVQLQKDGIIMDHEMSPDEKVFSPMDQLDKIDKVLRKQLEQDKLRRI